MMKPTWCAGRKRISLYLAILLFSFCGLPMRAQGQLQGSWIGGAEIGNELLSVSVQFQTDAKGPFAKVEVPHEGLKARAPVEVKDSHLRFDLHKDRWMMSFDGSFHDAMIEGTVRDGQRTGVFQLVRAIAAHTGKYGLYSGTYELAPGWILTVGFNEDAGLFYQDLQSGRIVALHALSEDTYFSGPALDVPAPIWAKLTFVKDEVGNVSGLIFDERGYPQRRARKLKTNEEEISFRSGDVTLSGTLILPNRKPPYSALVITQWGGPADRHEYQAAWWAYNGFAVLVYDKRGVGKSTGDWQTATIAELAQDASAGVGFLKRRQDINLIGITGVSQGSVAPLVATRIPDIAFLILTSASAFGREEVLREVEMSLRCDGFSDAEIAKAVGLRKKLNDAPLTGSGWDELKAEIQTHKQEKWFPQARVSEDWMEPTPRMIDTNRAQLQGDPILVWEKITIPVLLLYGDRDKNIPVAESTMKIGAALDKAGNRDTMLHWALSHIPMPAP